MKRFGFLFCLMLGSIGFLMAGSGSSDQKTLPVFSPADVPSWRIVVDGRPVDASIDLVSLMVVHTLHEPSQAEATFRLDSSPLSSGRIFTLPVDTPIEILLGRNSVLETVFTGWITSRRLSRLADEPLLYMIRAENKPLAVFPGSTPDSPLLSLGYGSSLLDFDLTLNRGGIAEGWVSMDGRTEHFLGNFVELSGLSSSFNRVLKVIRVEHQVHEQQWLTTLQVTGE